MLEERRVAVIPRVIVQGTMGPKEYGLLLTTSRSIFVLEDASKAGLGAVLGGAIGAAIAESRSERRRTDYSHADLSALAADEKNICIPHSAVSRVNLKKTLSGHQVRFEYTDTSGKVRKAVGTLVMPDELVARKKAEGVRAKTAREEYARMTVQALELALPPSLVQDAEWAI